VLFVTFRLINFKCQPVCPHMYFKEDISKYHNITKYPNITFNWPFP